MSDLAFLLATEPLLLQPDEAIRLGARAVALTRRQNVDALDALAAAYAAANRFDQAVEAEEAAIALATSSSSASQSVDRLRSRLASYRRGVPFRAERTAPR